MRHSKKIIHRAVNRINDPAIYGVRIAGTAFLAEQGNLRKRVEQNFRDDFLAAHVEFKLDVVGFVGIDALGPVPVVAHDFSGGARGFDGGSQGFFQRIFFHRVFC